MSTPKLSGKVALVTGASRGLGLAIARGLKDAGATVIVSSRKLDACESAVASLSDSGPGSAHPYALHVGHWDSIEPAVDDIITRFGGLDIVVNNAGIAPLAENLVSVTEGLWDKTIEVNLKGPFRLMAVAGNRMAAAGGGSIINISSIGAERPSPPEAMYAAAKNGLNALTRAFAQEYAPTVRVNCVMPGGFATDMSENWDEEFIGKIVDRLPAGRLGRPDELAGLITHLASDDAGYTTGAIIPVDGGRTSVY
ncbi:MULTISPECIES: SDR family NAD(P)-dependent oxidoreductase [unclassified Rhodococcus (in: high G+C Gram-positive bacteria)]|uniref:SDR family NAD(P)-dependent oxidoreductase n=1 Tax=unclassified Rhodococcus (in: high G+C Gram-positive bacteria) TaxID=192944 RepID=UPI000B9B0516|nr:MULTISPECIES: glucose 1-dehydrogenase [unclassified Rhodococcus (in: high G+C Gram-positive bacteria)]OZE37658.1 short-chain dehydrogenase [Rhodococcus sp. 05-2254-4]OZE40790.1 short-chain dehydrogenase [Rhodococcus sp. 05-2254-3]OZE45781.1 short-chain dehydrogenase [Rhodococcus sp. 05-2254-2]